MDFSTIGLLIETALNRMEYSLASADAVRLAVHSLRETVRPLVLAVPSAPGSPWEGQAGEIATVLVGFGGMMTVSWDGGDPARLDASMSSGRVWHISWGADEMSLHTAINGRSDGHFTFGPEETVDLHDGRAMFERAAQEANQRLDEQSSGESDPSDLSSGDDMASSIPSASPSGIGTAAEIAGAGALLGAAASTAEALFKSKQAAAKSCAKCGTALREDLKFCVECGAPVGSAERRCSNPGCGRVIHPGEKFCGNCGTKTS